MNAKRFFLIALALLGLAALAVMLTPCPRKPQPQVAS